MKYIGFHKHAGDMETYYGTPSSKRCKDNLEFQRILREEKNILKKRVLKWFDSYNEALEHEIFIHEKYKVDKNKMFYNDSKQRKNGFYYDRTGIKHTKEAKIKMSKIQRAIGNKPPNTTEWWTEEHSKKQSERMKGNTYKKGVIDSEETRKRKSESFRNSEAFMNARKKPISNTERANRSKRAKEMLKINNPMNNPESRKKLAETKIGLKTLCKNGKRKMAKPDSEKWNQLIKEDWKPLDMFVG
jgi:hypothetical protein